MRFFKRKQFPWQRPMIVHPGDIVMTSSGHIYRVGPAGLKQLPVVGIGKPEPIELTAETLLAALKKLGVKDVKVKDLSAFVREIGMELEIDFNDKKEDKK